MYFIFLKTVEDLSERYSEQICVAFNEGVGYSACRVLQVSRKQYAEDTAAKTTAAESHVFHSLPGISSYA
jgi:hypothetical protein